MIDVAAVLQSAPSFSKFCSIQQLQSQVEALRVGPTQPSISVIGASERGHPIHHIRFGNGSVKALFVGYVHANEVIGGLTVSSLMTLLSKGTPALISADVEWHIVPCIDPDGAELNEGWSQHAFTFDRYLKNWYRQEPCDQPERSFPIAYKRLLFNRPSGEAQILRKLIADIRPDFYFSLHNAWVGGAYFGLTRGIQEKYYLELRSLLQQFDVPLQSSYRPNYGGELFSAGVGEIFSAKKYYDFLESWLPSPEVGLHGAGAFPSDYLSEIKPDALMFIVELPYVRHSKDASEALTTQSLRQFKLELHAKNQFIATVILEEWENVQSEVEPASPFYRKVMKGLIEVKDKLVEGLPSWEATTHDLLFNPAYARTMSESERHVVLFHHRYYVLCNFYAFVRLLRVSQQGPAVTKAIERLEPLFDEALAELDKYINFRGFESIDCDTLGKVQLGSGLIALNSLLEEKLR